MANRSEKILNLSADVLSPRKMGKKESRKRPISQNPEKKKLKIDAEPSEKLTPFSKSTFETGIKITSRDKIFYVILNLELEIC